jgi:hypothetical protein
MSVEMYILVHKYKGLMHKEEYDLGLMIWSGFFS